MVRLLAISISSGKENKLGVRWVISKEKEPLDTNPLSYRHKVTLSETDLHHAQLSRAKASSFA